MPLRQCKSQLMSLRTHKLREAVHRDSASASYELQQPCPTLVIDLAHKLKQTVAQISSTLLLLPIKQVGNARAG